METALKERIVKLLEAVVGGSAQDNIPVVKQFEQEKMEAIEWLYPVEQDDLHGDRIDLDEARNMVEGINKSLKEGKLAVALNHKAKLTSVEITKAWINEHECMIGDTLVPEGWPLCKMKFSTLR